MEKHKILLVEDEVVIAKNEAQVIAEYGFTVSIAFTGEDAVKAVEQDTGIELVLMDINLGRGIDGTEAAGKILKLREIPIIFLTSHAEKEIVEMVKRITRYGYVLKNSGVFVLIESINMAFELFEVHQQLKKSEENLRITLDSIGDGVITTNIEGKIYRMNPMAQKLTGWELHEAQGKNLNEVFRIFNALSGALCDNPVIKVLKTGTTTGLANHTKLISRSGREFQIADSGSPIYNQKGEITGVVLIFRDITEEYELREEIRRREQQFQNLFRTMAEGLIMTDRTGHIIQVNPAAETILGLTRPEIETRNFISLQWEVIRTDGSPMPPEEMAGPRAMQEKQPVQNVIMGIKRPDHQVRWINVGAAPLFDETGACMGIVGTFLDITEWKVNQEKLQKSKQFYQTLFENSPDIILIVDSNFKFVMINRIKAGQYTRESLIGQDAIHVLPPGAQAPVKAMITDCFLKGEIRELEHEIEENKWVHARIIPIHLDNAIPYVMVISTDITERKQQEEMKVEVMRQENEALRCFALEATGVGVWDWNLQTNEVFVSDQGKMLLGYAENEIINTFFEWEKHVYADDRAVVNRELTKHCRGETPIYASEHRVVCKDGSCKRVVSRGKVVNRTEDGIPLRMIGTYMDISDRKQADKETKDQPDEKKLLLGEMHHRIKNNMHLLSSILSIQARNHPNPDVKKVLQEARGRIDVMFNFYCNLYEKKEFGAVALKKFIEDLLANVVSLYRIIVRVNLDIQIEEITVNRKISFPLGIIINECITNAFKYAFIGRENDCKNKITLSVQSKNNTELIINVMDNGKGFPDAILTAKTGGFGLNLIEMLVMQLAGSYRLYNTAQGACIEFLIPIYA